MKHGGESGRARDVTETLRRHSDRKQQEATGFTLSVTQAVVVAGNTAPLMTQETGWLCMFEDQKSTFHALTSLVRNSMM